MESETVEAATPATETPAAEKSFDERLMESIETKLQADGAATDSATDAAAATETSETPAAEATTETPAVETKTETAPEPFTAEQMGDPAFFDKLDKAGWERLNQLHPALYAMGKQVASARGKANAALKNPPAPVHEERSTEPPPKVSAELKAAILRSQSLDEDEAIEGAAEVALLTLRAERQRERQQQDASQKEARELYTSAYEMAVEELPELEGIPDKELDAEFDGSPRLTRKLNAATTHSDPEQRKLLVADVMAEAGRSVVAKRQAAADADAKAKADQKKADDQKRLKSNASNPSAAIAETQSGKAPRKGPLSFAQHGEAFIQAQLDKARAAGN